MGRMTPPQFVQISKSIFPMVGDRIKGYALNWEPSNGRITKVLETHVEADMNLESSSSSKTFQYTKKDMLWDKHDRCWRMFY